jgi:hypothetical protein
VRFVGGRAAPSLALMASLLWAGLAHAQAWLPSGGTGSVSASYTDSLVKQHFLSNGDTLDAGHIRFFNYDLSGEYSPTDKWMVVASLPIVESKYYGKFPHPTEVDDGSYHATATDLRTEVHYQWLLDPVAIAPYVAYVLPTHHYETLGHAAPGRGLHELWIGTGLGESLDKWIPKTYVETRVTYSQVEKVWDPSHVWHISHNKWMIDGDIGHFITPDLSVSVIGHWQRTLGGVSLPAPPQLFAIHDQAGMDNFLELGVGASWSYNDHSGFSFNFLKSIEGRNGHKLDRAVTVSYSYGFGQH